MVKYATYAHYKNEFAGSVPQADFNRLVIQATAKVKTYTSGRVDKMTYIPEDVKNCTCALVEKMYAENKNEGKQSETVGPHSVTFANKSKTEKEDEYSSLIKDFLSEVYMDDGTPILYRGV